MNGGGLVLLRELSTRVQRPLEFHRERKYEEKKEGASAAGFHPLPARGFLEFHDFAVQTRYEARFIRPVIANAS